MKLYLLPSIILIPYVIGCQLLSTGDDNSENSAQIVEKTILVPDKTEHDFGDLTSGEEVAAIFGFTNNGNAPLIIEDIKAGCGCTNLKYPRHPIPPGERGSIEVTFDTRGRHGNQRQAVRVYSNGSEESILLVIRANVR
ncbi:DUF1573 domain-containing protein [Alkalitalea saponilacus]|uniref:DUF1573 domain-containing protein n=1 Tax=Alkalitalea saponilacus TaxID=889453 RepID=A0A1T5H5H6_9BACT|nr:DUF1573 domain-containing protein [Alkalitalea saponilacus]ASB50870.1 hypothetical protein CDL62_17805 [Alkalitalea saponilacus]SKC15922.1 Protein of unknown function [Alkalitalea saponilacus]